MTTTRNHSGELSPQDLLHPLDIAAARPLYLTAMVLQCLASPAMLVGATLLLWSVSNNPFTPVIGPVIGLTIVSYVERRFRADAWAYVARKRQDLARQDPAPWVLLAVALPLILLGVGTFSFAGRMRSDQSIGEAGFGLGLLVGLVIVELAVTVWDRKAAPGTRSIGIAPGLRTFQAAAVGVIAACGAAAILTVVEIEVWSTALGALAVIAVSIAWYLLRLVPAKARCVPKSFPIP